MNDIHGYRPQSEVKTISVTVTFKESELLVEYLHLKHRRKLKYNAKMHSCREVQFNRELDSKH